MSDLTEAVRCALANITPGPWVLRGYDDVIAPRDDGMSPRLVVMVPAYSPEDSANLHLVANAPTWLAELCDRLDDAKAEIERRLSEYVPGRWWRAVAPDGSVWAETSDEEEVRRLARHSDRIDRLYVTEIISEWRADQIAAQVSRQAPLPAVEVGVKAPPGSPTPAAREGVAATSKATPSQHAGRDVDG